jgi:hypothetical protein
MNNTCMTEEMFDALIKTLDNNFAEIDARLAKLEQILNSR